MAHHITLHDSRKLSYHLDATPQDAPIVLLSNSLTGPFSLWDHVARYLNEHGFRTLRYDQPGHGSTDALHPPTDTTFDSMTDDVKGLLDSLDIVKLHGWVGDSMGAAAGVIFTTKYPGVVDRLAICDTIDASSVNVGGEDVFGPRVDAVKQAGSIEPMIQPTMERWFGKAWIEANPEEAQRVRQIMLTTTPDGFEACCSALRSKSFDLRPLLDKVGASVDKAICVVGENDANLPKAMEEMRSRVESGFEAAGKSHKVELKIISNAGHVPFIDGFKQFCETIVPFLQQS